MAKTHSDKLFRLIKSLSSSEKRYFILWAQTKADRQSRYVHLFEEYDNSAEQNDPEVVKKIYPGETVNGKKYTELKAYLYDLILKALQAFDEQSSVDYRLRHLLQSVSVLFRRGFYADCRELLGKARRLAFHFENFAILLEILRWEKHIAYALSDMDLLAKEIQRIEYEEDTCIKQLQNLSDYRRLFLKVWTSVKTEAAARREDRIEKIHHLIDNPLLNNFDEARSHMARVLFLRTKTIYHYLTLDYDLFYENGLKLIQLQESKPWFLAENLTEYIASLSNFLLACGLLQRYDEVAETLEKFRDLKPITHDDRVKIQRQYFSGKLNLCVFTGDFEEGRKEMARLDAETKGADRAFFESASFQFQFFSIAFGCQEYELALDSINKILGQHKTIERQDLQSLARMLNLLVHFEMGNMELLESLLRSSTRYLKSKNRLFEMEKSFIRFLGKLTKASSKKEQTEAFLAEKQQYLAEAESPVGRILLQYFDFESWIESKISESSFAQTVRKKAEKYLNKK